jgi:hypothetical protein
MPTKTPEEIQKEHENRIAQLRYEISDLEKVRNDLTNEIKKQREEAQAKSDKEHSERMERLEGIYQKKKTEQDATQKYLDDYMVRLDNKAVEQKKEQERLIAKENDLNLREASIDSLNRKLASDIRDANTQFAKDLKGIQDKALAQSEKDEAQDLREKNLNEKEQSFENSKTIIDAKIAENAAILAKNEGILTDISEKEINIQKENAEMKSILEDIQKEREEVAKLSVYKDDLAKFEIEKKSLEALRASTKVYSKQVEERDKAVIERETSATEKEKYLTIKEREVSGKIAILQKLRAEPNA